MMNGPYYRPALKGSVDVQLQSAFSDGNWPTVIRLAARRSATLKDPYYEAIKTCAESQLDGPAERSSAVLAVDALVRKSTAVPDVETLELYEWACHEALPTLSYPETLGLLRARWVKANPKSALGIECLKACLLNWDLVNAQQIAAALDKGHPNSNDRRYMFWSITLTYLLSISPQCPDSKANIYGMLAAKQLIKAAEVAGSGGLVNASDRSLQEEEEFNLLYIVLRARNEWPSFIKTITSPKIGAMKLFGEGRKHPFLQGIDAFEAKGEWDSVYDFCNNALSRTDEDGSPSLLASDWRVWKSFITAASKKPDPESALREVQGILERFTSMTSKIAEMYKKNLSLALLELSFQIPRGLLSLDTVQDKPSVRVIQICVFIDQHAKKSSLFDDIKHYVEQLTAQEVTPLLENMLPKLSEGDDRLKAISIRILDHKLRYLLATRPGSLTYSTPGEPPLNGTPHSSLEAIASSALETYKSIDDDAQLLELLPQLDRDPRIDLALVSAMSLLKLAGLSQAPSAVCPSPTDIQVSRILQAILILDAQLSKSQKEVPLRVLLVQLYLLIGCASLAYQLWVPLDVKRTILDALGPLFFDRLSSLSPGLFLGDRRPLMEPVLSYYSMSLRSKAPVRIWDAFAAGSYSAAVDMATYADRLQRSSTLVMAVVEERRATRAVGGRIDGAIEDVPLLSDVHEDTVFVNATDYGSLPNLESSHSPRLVDLIRLGPGLSNERSHLSLLSERYLDLITFKPPKEYKPAKAGSADEKDYAIEVLSRIHSSMSAVLDLPSTPSKLTASEEKYYNVVSVLAAMLLKALTSSRSDPVPDAFSHYGPAIRSTLSSLRAAFLATPPSTALPMNDVLSSLMNQLALSALRDTALAIKQTSASILSWNDKELARDRSGKSALRKDIIAEVKELDALATKALGEVKARIKTLKEALGQGGWLDRISEWTLGPGGEGGHDDALAKKVLEVVGQPALEDWSGRVVENWREGVRGWWMVKME